jgi:hypothetical protein
MIPVLVPCLTREPGPTGCTQTSALSRYVQGNRGGRAFASSRSPARQRLPAGGGDAHAGDLDLAIAGVNALAAGVCETCAHELDEQRNGKAVREQDRLGAAVRAAREQRECSAVLSVAYEAELTRHGA